MKPTILHLSNDYPDVMAPHKTKAIYHLVQGTPEFRHIVYSLNRVTAWSGIESLPSGEDCTAIAYGALPKGLFWKQRLQDVAEWIKRDLLQKNIRPDLVEAHKYTVEGIIGLELARHYNVPLVIDIQGNTDCNILRRKPGFRSIYREIAKEAKLVFPFAPWSMKPFMELAELPPHKCRVLPVIPGTHQVSEAPLVATPKIVTIFHLNTWDRKNVHRLMAAVEKIAPKFPGISLDVYGSGSPETILDMRSRLRDAPGHRQTTFKGPLQHSDFHSTLQHYAIFAMPSLHESYGMVYIEALCNGLPVLFSKDRGIDGVFDEKDVGYACDPTSVEDIAQGLDYLLSHQAPLKKQIGELQAKGGLDFVLRDGILQTYREGIRAALAA